MFIHFCWKGLGREGRERKGEIGGSGIERILFKTVHLGYGKEVG